MAADSRRVRYKALWIAALLFCLSEIVCAQTRLGLHVTQEELNIWRQRAQNGPYKIGGDVCTNSPGDWERIVSHANAFLSHPSEERWKGQVKAVGVKPYDPIAPRRAQGERIRDAAFYFLVTGDTRFRDAVRHELLAQAAEPGSDFTDRTRWGLSLTGDPNPNFEITLWLNRQLFAYDYVRSTLAKSQCSTLDSWFLNAARYWERAADVSIRQMYPKRNSDDYATLGPNWQVETTQCTWYHGVTHYGGWKRVNWHEIWNNRDADMMRFAGLVGIMVNDDHLKAQAKRFFKEWMRHSVFPDGMAQEFIRWEENYPSLGWAYAASLIGSMAVLADAFARMGDLELFQFSTSQGFSTSVGTMTPDGGPKNLHAVMTHHAKYVDKSIVRYGTDQESRHGNPAYVIGPVNVPNGEAWVNENFWIQANLYYKDPYLQSIYLRTARDCHPYPANPSTGGWSGWTGCCGLYPGALFMFGQMEGKVWPYPVGGLLRVHPENPRYFADSAGWIAGRAAMGRTHRFAEWMNLAAMTPQPKLASTGYCLACPGTEYLIYQPLGEEGLSAELTAGTYRYEWFSPAKGEDTGSGTVQASGGAQQFKAPFAGDAVLYLKQARRNE